MKNRHIALSDDQYAFPVYWVKYIKYCYTDTVYEHIELLLKVVKVGKTFSLIVSHIFPLFICCRLLHFRGWSLAVLCRWWICPAILFRYCQTVHKALVWFSPSLSIPVSIKLSVSGVTNSEEDELSAEYVLLTRSSQTQPSHALSMKKRLNALDW